MKKMVLGLSLLLGYNQLNAQTAADSVKMTVNNLFAAMKGSDSVGIMKVFSENAVLQTITKNEEGKVVVRDEKVSEFAGFVAKEKVGSLDERISFESIKIDGDLASVWTPYLFYLNDTFRHCGVNSFQLVRLGGEWKIQYLIDTRRKEPCSL
jgi:hypothetical protein